MREAPSDSTRNVQQVCEAEVCPAAGFSASSKAAASSSQTSVPALVTASEARTNESLISSERHKGTMKILFVCGLLMLISDSVLPAKKKSKVTTTVSPARVKERYENFKRQHIADNTEWSDCDSMMSKRTIYDDNGSSRGDKPVSVLSSLYQLFRLQLQRVSFTENIFTNSCLNPQTNASLISPKIRLQLQRVSFTEDIVTNWFHKPQTPAWIQKLIMKLHFVCFLLVLLSAHTLSTEPTFQEKHVIQATDNQRDCTTLMNNRNLFTAKDKKVCRAANTFIVESNELTVNSVCTGGVKEKESDKPFTILDCTFDKKKTSEPKTNESLISSERHKGTMKILLVCGLLMLLSHSVSGRQIQIRVESSHSVFPTIETDESTKPQPEERYEKFRRQHIDKDMTEQKCDSVILKNNISNADKNCKEINTFILAGEDEVKAICKGVKDEMIQSQKEFNIVDCKLTNVGAKFPDCKYEGTRLTKKVEVKCEEELPVHYEKHLE
ncbi:hypothetical protein Q5P01_000138 [Channa striata]|uniref:Ribonuclease A-domain domain-containing protein n=1 Tax=Channa striata TaxID=64152 RepID=A0AA88IW04_CHASR|nr:hypothetical protein Q5P01_000138 [Channa striata]